MTDPDGGDAPGPDRAADDGGGPEADDIDGIAAAWRRERPDLPVDSIGVVSRIWRIGRLLERERDAVLRRVGTDRSTLDLLSTLRRSGPPYRLTPGEIVARTLLTSGGVSQRLARAEERGLIERAVSPSDGRSVEVVMTPVGAELLDRTVAAVLRAESDLLAGIAPADREQLAGLLRDLLAHLTGDRPEPAG